jgi:hypothetical protein
MSKKRPAQQRESREAVSGLGDDQGTRVGAPDQSRSGTSTPREHSDSRSSRPDRQTGVGSEASEGMHNSQQGGSRDETETTGLSGQETGRSTRQGGKRAGSEPLAEDGDQHRSGYGGAGGSPVNSSDTREPTRKR